MLHRVKNHVEKYRMAEALNGRHFETEEEAIVAYFSLGIRHETILLYLRRFHGFDISLRTLPRRLSELNLHEKAQCCQLLR